MNSIEHTHAAIISLTQYEAAQYHGDMGTARACLFDTMGHIVAIAKLITGDTDAARRPRELGRPERKYRYIRCIDSLSACLIIPDWNGHIHRHIALVWWECVELCVHHGWMPPEMPVLPQGVRRIVQEVEW